MRHRLKENHLSRKVGHRRSLLSNLTCELIKHKRIVTTVAKAKALRVYVEPILTKAKSDTTHQRRIVFSYLQNKEAVKELFGPISVKIAERPGGYTRIIKLGKRLGDNAEMALIELVDFNDIYSKEAGANEGAKRTRRGGRRKKSTTTEEKPVAAQAENQEEKKEAETEAAATEAKAEEAVAEEEKEARATDSPAEEESKEEAPKAEKKKDDDKKKGND